MSVISNQVSGVFGPAVVGQGPMVSNAPLESSGNLAGNVNSPAGSDSLGVGPSQANPGTPSAEFGGGSPGAAADSRGTPMGQGAPTSGGSSPTSTAASVESGAGLSVSFNG